MFGSAGFTPTSYADIGRSDYVIIKAEYPIGESNSFLNLERVTAYR
jgi:hypothetical protein